MVKVCQITGGGLKYIPYYLTHIISIVLTEHTVILCIKELYSCAYRGCIGKISEICNNRKKMCRKR